MCPIQTVISNRKLARANTNLSWNLMSPWHIFVVISHSFPKLAAIQLTTSEKTHLPCLYQCIDCMLLCHWWVDGKHFLKLNKEKTEELLISPKSKTDQLYTWLGSLTLQTKSDVTTYFRLSRFKPEMDKVAKTAFSHMRNIAKLRTFLTPQDAGRLINDFVLLPRQLLCTF